MTSHFCSVIYDDAPDGLFLASECSVPLYSVFHELNLGLLGWISLDYELVW